MAKKRSKSRKGAGGIGARISAIRSVQWSKGRPYVIGAAWVVCIGALTVATALGVPQLWASAAQAAIADRTAITFIDRPAWVNGDLLALLEMTAQHQIAGDVFDREDLIAVRSALLNTGWFDSIEQVRRVRADLVEVHGTFVRPFALIRDDEGDHLVDPHGRLLPRTYARGEASQFIVISGAHFDRPQRPGAQWDGEDITAALRLLRLIDDKFWRDQITTIDVGDYLSRQTLMLLTDRSSQIVWGSAPGEETPGEARAELKLSYLDYQAEHLGHIDGGYAGELDITSTTGVFAR